MALSFDASQQTAVDADSQVVTWLFYIYRTDTTEYFWSTKDYDYEHDAITDEYDANILDESDDYIFGGASYSSKIPGMQNAFSGIRLNRPRAENNIVAGASMTFTAHNVNNTLTASDFDGAKIVLRLLINDVVIRTHTLVIKKCEPGQQTLRFTCVDYLQKYLNGDYPNTRLVRDIFPEDTADIQDNVCIPEPYGVAYIPIRSDFISASSARYYILGSTTLTFTINAVRSPRAWGAKSEWGSSGYSFTQSIKNDGTNNWRVFQPIIADTDNNGVADASMVWKSGDYFLDMPTKFSRSDTASTDNPADVIELVLEGFGVPSVELDTGGGSTFESAGTTLHTTRGIAWNGAFWFKQPRRKVLAQLLNSCNATLDCAEKIELRVLSNTSQNVKAGQANIESKHIIRSGDVAGTSFNYRNIQTDNTADSGYVGYAPNTESQDRVLKILVPASTATSTPGGDIVELPFIGDSQIAQKLGTLFYQKKLLKQGEISFRGTPELLVFQPGDFITISGNDYGGTKTVMVDSMAINKDLSIDFRCIEFSVTMSDYDWDDLSPSVVSPSTDTSSQSMSIGTVGPDPTAGASLFYADTINERTIDGGVTIDGVKLKDSEPYCDVINEKSTGTGVTVDGMLIKDGVPYCNTVSESSAGAGVTVDGMLIKDGVPYCNTVSESSVGAGVTVDNVLLKDGGVTALSTGIISSNTISEVTSSAGVTVDGMLIKDGVPYCNTVSESSAGAGVTVDSVLLKDGSVAASSTGNISSNIISEVTSSAGVTVDGVLCKNGGITLSSGVAVYGFSTDTTLSGDSVQAVPVEKAVKGYVDNLTSTDFIESGTPVSGTWATTAIVSLTISNGIVTAVSTS